MSKTAKHRDRAGYNDYQRRMSSGTSRKERSWQRRNERDLAAAATTAKRQQINVGDLTNAGDLAAARHDLINAGHRIRPPL